MKANRTRSLTLGMTAHGAKKWEVASRWCVSLILLTCAILRIILCIYSNLAASVLGNSFRKNSSPSHCLWFVALFLKNFFSIRLSPLTEISPP